MALIIPNLASISLRNTKKDTDKVPYTQAERELAQKCVSMVARSVEIPCDVHESQEVLDAIVSGMNNPRNKGEPSVLGHMRHGFETYAKAQRAKENKDFSTKRCYAAIVGLLRSQAVAIKMPKAKVEAIFDAPEKVAEKKA